MSTQPTPETSVTSKTKNKARNEINAILDALDVADSVRTIAHTTCEQAAKNGFIGGNRSATRDAAACAYYACRVEGKPVTADELAAVSDHDTNDITRVYRQIVSELSLPTPPDSPHLYTDRVADVIGASTYMTAAAEALLQTAWDDGGVTRSGKPSATAAAAFYTVGTVVEEWKITLQTAADAGNACVVTIRSRHKELEAYLDAISDHLPERTPDEEGEETADDSSVDEQGGDSEDDANLCVRIGDTEVAGTTDKEVMVNTVNQLIEDHGLLDVISVPYTAPRCRNPLIVGDPIGPTRKFTWEELVTGDYLNTKLPWKGKMKRLRTLADMVEVPVTIDHQYAG